MKKTFFILLCSLFSLSFVFGGGLIENTKEENTYLFVDSCGRTVEIPFEVNKVAVSGNMASIIMSCIAPEYMVNVDAKPSDSQQTILPHILSHLPATGNLYGGKNTINLEEIISSGAQILIDAGTYRSTISESIEDLQDRTGIPCIFIEANPENLASCFRTLGNILYGKKEKANIIADFIDKTFEIAANNKALIKEDKRKSALIFGYSDNVVFADGTVNSAILDIVGIDNAFKSGQAANKGNEVSSEQLYIMDPEILLFTDSEVYAQFMADYTYKNLRAVKNGTCYCIPSEPYSWTGQPSCVNLLFGIYWLGNLVYPDLYDYDIEIIVKDIYKMLWNYDFQP